MKMRTSRRGGFTLVEIMIVVAIIGLLAAIAIPNFVKARTASQTNACIANLKQIQGAKATWALELKKVDTDTPADADLFGATAYIRHVRSGRSTPSPWMAELLKRKPPKLAAVALANKTARIAWKLMTSGERYDPARRAAREALAA